VVYVIVVASVTRRVASTNHINFAHSKHSTEDVRVRGPIARQLLTHPFPLHPHTPHTKTEQSKSDQRVQRPRYPKYSPWYQKRLRGESELTVPRINHGKSDLGQNRATPSCPAGESELTLPQINHGVASDSSQL
jgi:hypothetical protein